MHGSPTVERWLQGIPPEPGDVVAAHAFAFARALDAPHERALRELLEATVPEHLGGGARYQVQARAAGLLTPLPGLELPESALLVGLSWAATSALDALAPPAPDAVGDRLLALRTHWGHALTAEPDLLDTLAVAVALRLAGSPALRAPLATHRDAVAAALEGLQRPASAGLWGGRAWLTAAAVPWWVAALHAGSG